MSFEVLFFTRGVCLADGLIVEQLGEASQRGGGSSGEQLSCVRAGAIRTREPTRRRETLVSSFSPPAIYFLFLAFPQARMELQAKRREEKELKTAERAHLKTIAELESDVTKLNLKADKNRDTYENLKRNFQDQCAEAEKLRNLVAETRRVRFRRSLFFFF